MKNIIDDGLNPELLRNARFAGVYEMPVIEKPNKINERKVKIRVSLFTFMKMTGNFEIYSMRQQSTLTN